MSGTRVGVLIVNYRSGDLLRRCLAALAGQTVAPDRVLLVDNGSDDGSLQGVEQLYPGISVVRPGDNTGFARGNNLGLDRLQDTEWVALLNPDAVPEPDWLEQLMSAAARHPDAAALGSRMYSDESGERLDGTGDVLHVSGLVWRRDHGRFAAAWRLDEEEIFAPCAAAALYRRDLLEQVGGFDEDFFCYTEDVDLGFRLRLLGYRCYYIPTARVLHLGSAVSGAKSAFTLYHGHRNLLWLYVKNMPGPLLAAFAPLHVAMHLLAVLRYLPAGMGATLLRAKRDALLGLPRMWRKRRAIQATRKIGCLALLRVMNWN